MRNCKDQQNLKDNVKIHLYLQIINKINNHLKKKVKLIKTLKIFNKMDQFGMVIGARAKY